MHIEDMHLVIRNLKHEDYPRLKALMDLVYDDIGGAWPEHTINKLIDEFPEGQICVFDGDELVGVALSVLVRYDRFSNPHSYEDLIGKRMTILNDPDGDALYGLDVLSLIHI